VLYISDANAHTDIDTRYGITGDCGTWAGDMKDIWDNYYSVKKTNISPVKTRADALNGLYTTNSTGYRDQLASLTTPFQTFMGVINASI
jgi:hypothetical protein